MTALDTPVNSGSSPEDAATVEAELLASAKAIRPLVTEQAAETEERTHYSEEIHKAFLDAGFYRMTVPRRYGGLEVSQETFLQVINEIAAGDVSTAWCLCLGTSHAFHVAALFGEQAQAELFKDGWAICPSIAAPYGSATRQQDGSWELSGTWNYGSGAPYGTMFLGQTFEAKEDGSRGQLLLFVVPRDQWTMVDDWGGTLGLRGSGSNSIHMDGAKIPAHYVLEGESLAEASVDKRPGVELHDNPNYGGRIFTTLGVQGAVLGIGGVNGAIEEYETLLRSRKTPLPPIIERHKSPDYQSWMGHAIRRNDAAEAIMMGISRRWTEYCRLAAEEGRPFTREDDLRLSAALREAKDLIWEAMHEDLFRTAGSSASKTGQRLERIFRDESMTWGHLANVLRDGQWRHVGQELVGLADSRGMQPDRAPVTTGAKS